MVWGECGVVLCYWLALLRCNCGGWDVLTVFCDGFVSEFKLFSDWLNFFFLFEGTKMEMKKIPTNNDLRSCWVVSCGAVYYQSKTAIATDSRWPKNGLDSSVLCPSFCRSFVVRSYEHWTKNKSYQLNHSPLAIRGIYTISFSDNLLSPLKVVSHSVYLLFTRWHSCFPRNISTDFSWKTKN